MSETEEFWTGACGDEYIERNKATTLRTLVLERFWKHILDQSPPFTSILEVGANVGDNLRAISKISPAELFAVEPNEVALAKLVEFPGIWPYKAPASKIPMMGKSVDMAFTSGVLIHIHPDELLAACEEIYRVSQKYILCIEYFSPEPVEVEYRGHSGKLWKRDFGSFWMDNFDLNLVAYEFFWERASGMDNVTMWLMEKP